MDIKSIKIYKNHFLIGYQCNRNNLTQIENYTLDTYINNIQIEIGASIWYKESIYRFCIVGIKNETYSNNALYLHKNIIELISKWISRFKNTDSINKTTNVILSGNGIGDKGMDYLNKQNCKTLITLDLSGNSIGDKGMDYFNKWMLNTINQID